MSTEQIIRNLRGLINGGKLDQHEIDVVCAAIRALGGNP